MGVREASHRFSPRAGPVHRRHRERRRFRDRIPPDPHAVAARRAVRRSRICQARCDVYPNSGPRRVRQQGLVHAQVVQLLLGDRRHGLRVGRRGHRGDPGGRTGRHLCDRRRQPQGGRDVRLPGREARRANTARPRDDRAGRHDEDRHARAVGQRVHRLVRPVRRPYGRDSRHTRDRHVRRSVGSDRGPPRERRLHAQVPGREGVQQGRDRPRFVHPHAVRGPARGGSDRRDRSSWHGAGRFRRCNP